MCVIGVGASLNRHTIENGYLYPNAKYVHIDSKPHVMMSDGRLADVYVQSDAQDRRRRAGQAAGREELQERPAIARPT